MSDPTKRRTGPRYRIVPVTKWRDARFLKLSPRGRELFDYLTTGPCATRLGVFYLSLATIADDMRRDLRTVKAALAEVIAAGLVEYDPEARLLWRPGALDDDPIESPANILGARTAWSELPPCALRDKVRAHLVDRFRAKGPVFSSALSLMLGEGVQQYETPGGVEGGEPPSPSPDPDPDPKPAALAGDRGRPHTEEIERAKKKTTTEERPTEIFNELIIAWKRVHEIKYPPALRQGVIGKLEIRKATKGACTPFRRALAGALRQLTSQPEKDVGTLPSVLEDWLDPANADYLEQKWPESKPVLGLVKGARA